MTTDFAHLHVHSQFSILDGMGDVKEYVQRAKELGQTSLALTDHGLLAGAPSFYHAARAVGVEPIIGCEHYFSENAEDKTKHTKDEASRFHVGILAKGYEGYRILAELNTATHQQFHYKPLLDRKLVESLGDATQHLVALSGCGSSLICRHIRGGRMDEAVSELLWWREMFPHFYIELMHHGCDFDESLNIELLRLSERYKIPYLFTNDPHYVAEEDAYFHDHLLAIQTASDLEDPERFRFSGEGYYLKSRAEMFRTIVPNYGKAIWKQGAEETLRVAKMCHTRIPAWEKRTWHIPKYVSRAKSLQGLSSQQILVKLSRRGLRTRGVTDQPEYRRRMVRELRAIEEVGIADFLLITRECIQWARRQGIPVGPGRGSVAGSLVGWLIGIHKIDPIRYDLMFERFLNPARPKMPDIDTDFGPTRRGEMFKFAERRYGKENVVHVCAFQTMKVRRAFRALAKSYGIPFPLFNRLSKLLPDEADDDTVWPKEFEEVIVKEYPELERVLRRLAGMKCGLSSHPAGVIIADPEDRIRNLVPEMWLASSKSFSGQYDLDAVEEMGLLKEDFLSLRNLETIASAVELIERSTEKLLDPDSWVPDEEPEDAKVYAMLARGETRGVFQFEGVTNTRGIKEIGPTCFEDLVSCTSLYRTGLIAAGFPAIFKRHRQTGKYVYPHPSLAPLLDHSYGVILYQETIMEMGAQLAGFDMLQVDDIKECLVGETVVYRTGQNQHDSRVAITVEELCRIFQEPDSVDGKMTAGYWYRYQGRGTKIRAFKEGKILPATVVDVKENGPQPVWRISLSDGKSIVSTANHRHLTTEGWRRVDRIQLGDQLLVDSGESLRHSRERRQPGTWKRMARIVATDGRLRWGTHGHSTALTLVKRQLPDHCEWCGAEGVRLDAAHLDHDRSNNRRENVLRLCATCHSRHDTKEAAERRGLGERRLGRWGVGNRVDASEVVSITYEGVQQTYDLVLSDRGHNFVANGIVTHNSIKHKKSALMESMEDPFVNGCVAKTGMTPEEASATWDMIKGAAGYLYNRSHAVAYTMISYQTARLKCLYPVQFSVALLRTVDDKDKRQEYLNIAQADGMVFDLPHINTSGAHTDVDHEDRICFGFTDIAGIGPGMASRILDNRPEGGYLSLEEVTAAVNNVKVMACLADAGALRDFGVPHNLARIEELLGFDPEDRIKKWRDRNDGQRRPNLLDAAWDFYAEVRSITHRLTKSKKPYVVWKVRWAPGQIVDIQLWSTSQKAVPVPGSRDKLDLWKVPVGAVVRITGDYSEEHMNIGISSANNVRVVEMPEDFFAAEAS